MAKNEMPLPLIKVLYADLVRFGIVSNRPNLRDLIQRGTIRPPHKDGTSRQARAWWYWDEILEDLEREKATLTKAETWIQLRRK